MNRLLSRSPRFASTDPAPARGRTILIADDLPANVGLLKTLLCREGYVVHEVYDGQAALDAALTFSPDLVLMDVVMPGMTGFEVCRELKRHPATRLTPVILVTALSDTTDRVQGIDAGADDFLTKPINQHELRARVRSLIRLKRYTDELDSAESVLISLALTIEARDAYTDGHCQRLAWYCSALGKRIALADDQIEALRRGGFLHDIGKVAVPDAVLLKPGRLTPAEYELIKQHPIVGDGLCSQLRSLQSVCPIVRHHHEHLDGSGYPDGLRGDAIPLLAQIAAVADVYDALTSARPYKRAIPTDRACQILEDEVKRGWWNKDLLVELVGLLSSSERPPVLREQSSGSR